jgi:enterochelin esterase-like enzyme
MVEMPDAPPQPWLAEEPGIPAGQVEKRRFKSVLLKNEREIAVYLPPGYAREAKPYPLLVVFDEIDYLGDPKQIVLVPTPTILNNLISAKRIPPMVALLVDNVPGRRDRELPCNPVFADFLSSELLPWAHSLYNFTADPRQTVVTGSSFGGLAAACTGLRHPETFGKSSHNRDRSTGCHRRVTGPRIRTRIQSRTGSRASSSPALRSRFASIWTQAARSSMFPGTAGPYWLPTKRPFMR